MLKRKRVDIIFALVFIILIAILILAIPSTTVTGEEEEAPKVYIAIDQPKQINIDVTMAKVKVPEYKSLGTFRVTAYCACSKCCSKSDGITASGTKATQGRTVAVDPSQIPYGTRLMFNGHEYIAEDCGSGINANCIDLYFDSHQEALEWGVQMHEVFVIWK